MTEPKAVHLAPSAPQRPGVKGPSNIVPPGLQGQRVTMPRCPGCGFSVEKAGDVCEACADKPQFQQRRKPMVDLADHPDPAYHDSPPIPTSNR